MPYSEISIDIDAPPEKVWGVLTDIDRWPGWTESVHGVSRISEGAFGLGSFARLDLAGGPPSDWTVTEFDPGRMFTWESKAPGVHSTAGHIIEPRDGGSRVHALGREHRARRHPSLAIPLTSRQAQPSLGIGRPQAPLRVNAGVAASGHGHR